MLIVAQFIRVSPYLLPAMQSAMASIAFLPPVGILLLVYLAALATAHSNLNAGVCFVPFAAAGGTLGLSAAVSSVLTLRRALRRTPLESTPDSDSL